MTKLGQGVDSSKLGHNTLFGNISILNTECKFIFLFFKSKAKPFKIKSSETGHEILTKSMARHIFFSRIQIHFLYNDVDPALTNETDPHEAAV